MRVQKVVVTTFFVILYFKNHFTDALSIYFDGNSTTNILYSEGDDLDYYLTENFELILKFIKSHMSNRFVKIIDRRLENDKMSDKIIQRLESPHVIITTPTNLHGREIFRNALEYHKFYDYLFFPDNLQQAISIIKFAYNQEDWAPRRRFLNIITCNWDDKNISNALVYFKNLLAYNVVFIKSCKGNLTGYTWMHKRIKKKKCVKFISLIKFNLNDNTFNPFDGKNLKYVNGCPLKIGWFYGTLTLSDENNIKGYPYYILKEFARIVDAKIILNEESSRYRANFVNNVSFDPLIEDMEKDKVDISVGYTLLTPPSPLVERTLPIKWRRNYWLIPKRRSILSDYLLFRDLSVFLWLILLFVSVSILCMTSFCMTPYLYEIISKWPFLLTCIVFGIGVGSFRIKLISFRISLFFGIIFGIYVSVVFYSLTNSVLTNPPLEPKITNLHQLIDSRFQLRMFKGYITSTAKQFDNETQEKILAKWIPPKYTVVFNETRDFINSTEQAIWTNERILKIIRNYKEIDWIPDEPYAGVYDVFVVRNGFPLLHRMNQVLHRIHESGIIKKWINLEMFSYPKLEVPIDLHRTAIPLTLPKMKGAFMILGTGLLLSIIIFIFEIIFHK